MFNLHDFGYIRTEAAVPPVVVGNPEENANRIMEMIDDASRKHVDILVFPELCITGYTCGDLFQQETLIAEAERQVMRLANKVTDSMLVFVGVPVHLKGEGLYNCACAIHDGHVIGIVPKTFVPNYSEFYEKRWFTHWSDNIGNRTACYAGSEVTIGTDILFNVNNCLVGCEICEDVWVPRSPSTTLAKSGALIIVNLSAGNEVVGKAGYREELIRMNSAKNVCGYVYANAGACESTQDVVFSGHSMIAENGTMLDSVEPFADGIFDYGLCCIADIDVERLSHERMRSETFNQEAAKLPSGAMLEIIGASTVWGGQVSTLYRYIDGHPFIPHGSEIMNRAKEITRMQAYGLAKRIKHVNCDGVVLGISGGLDSTLALLVAHEAFTILHKDVKNIHCITMPGFGTTSRTKTNAEQLVEDIGATLITIPIGDAAKQHLEALGHSLDVHDITYENAQARERTQILFDYANMHNLIVVGTGDLSELALGWCTYNGDQMSNYGVNASIPKTLVKWLVYYYRERYSKENAALSNVLQDIIDTPVSPELLPPDENGNIAQKTENSIGSYDLHDFFLYNVIRNGYTPEKIFLLAHEAVNNGSLLGFNAKTVLETLKMFYKRFFSQQFKRSCMPDGVKVGTIALSPRGDWRMPSDASAKIWIERVDALIEDHSDIWPEN